MGLNVRFVRVSINLKLNNCKSNIWICADKKNFENENEIGGLLISWVLLILPSMTIDQLNELRERITALRRHL